MNAEFWDNRYKENDYAYGEEPNSFLKEVLPDYKPSKMLFPADGEGRNSVYAASLGHRVYAFDISEQGKIKAEQLAQKNKVNIHYEVNDVLSVNYKPEFFDALVFVFVHFPEKNKMEFYRYLNQFLKPGGTVIIEVFSKQHIEYNSINPQVGGPSDISMLFSELELKEIYNEFNILHCETKVYELNEGNYHKGLGSVLRFIAKKM